jgi:hypothetical protein
MLPQLSAGALAGAGGALARELSNTDREFTWALVPKTASGLLIGTAGWAGAATFGVQDEWGRYAAAFVVGMLGQAAIADLARAIVRSRLGLPKQ